MSAALASLTDAFDAPFGRRGDAAEEALPAAVTSWPTVPVEIIRAAGLRPLVMRGRSASTSLAAAVLEKHVFPNRLRQLVEAALGGELSRAACVVLPRTSDPDYKAFLYLRELIRRNLTSLRAPVLLFDLLQSDGADVLAYDTARTRELFGTLAVIGQRSGSVEDVRDAMARADLARAALRRLVALRRGAPRVSGAEVLPLIGAFWRLPPEDYALLAHQAADVLARRAPLDGLRVLLAGAPVDGSALHAAIESHGAVVVAEPGPWGSEAAGGDVSPGIDPFAMIAERYRQYAIGPRRGALRRYAERWLEDIDAVVVSLPPDDAVFGWEYPALCAWMEEHRLPHVCVAGDPYEPLSPHDHERLAALVAGTSRRTAAHHG